LFKYIRLSFKTTPKGLFRIEKYSIKKSHLF
jgi:hypothetical protein